MVAQLEANDKEMKRLLKDGVFAILVVQMMEPGGIEPSTMRVCNGSDHLDLEYCNMGMARFSRQDGWLMVRG